jgi:hypothetical protein
VHNVDRFSFARGKVKAQQTYETQMHWLLAILRSKVRQKQAATPNNRKIADYFRCDAVASLKVAMRDFSLPPVAIAPSTCLTNSCGRLDHALGG